MTTDQAKWLVEEFKPKMQLRVDREHATRATKAINIMTDGNRSVPSCSCEFMVTVKISQNMYSQYESEINKLYEEGRKTLQKRSRGRKANQV